MSDKLVRTSTAIKSEGDFAEKLSETRSSIVQRPQVDSGLISKVDSGLVGSSGTDSRQRGWIMNFGPVGVPAGETIAVSTTTRCYFRGDKIINTGEIEGLYVTRLYVRIAPQLRRFWEDGRPGQLAFGGFGVDEFQRINCQMDLAGPADSITFIVSNTSKETRMFAMTIVGKVNP